MSKWANIDALKARIDEDVKEDSIRITYRRTRLLPCMFVQQ